MPEKSVLKVIDIRHRMRDWARLQLLKAVRVAMQDDDLRGWALVTWDNSGRSTISWDAQYGPIRMRMIPDFVKNSLAGQIVIEDTLYQAGIERVDDDPSPDVPA